MLTLNKETKIFTRNYFSYFDISIYVLIALLLFFGIKLFANKSYLGGTLVFLLLILILLAELRGPKQVIIDSDGVHYGVRIMWEEITNVLFTVGGGRDYRNTVIKVEFKGGDFVIYTKSYKNSKELRYLFEDMCRKKNIHYKVEDLGCP